LDVAAVREVLDFTVITKIPRTPDFMRGVINLRGSVVPVLDLRLAFNMTMTEKTVNTCIIVWSGAGRRAPGHRSAGRFGGRGGGDGAGPDPAAPSLGASIKTDFIRGMAGAIRNSS